MTEFAPHTVPKGWQRCLLSDFTNIVMGQSPPSTSYNRNGDGLPFFQGKREFRDLYPALNLYCSQPKKIANQGAILLSVRAPVGPTNLAPQECCIGRGLVAIHACGGIHQRFLLYLLRSEEPKIAGKGTGSTFKAITKASVENLQFNLPPKFEQRRIVTKIEELFSELDKGVESLKTARAQLETYRQAVLKHAFEGKLTADWREENKDKLETPEQLLARIKREREAHHERQHEEWKAAVNAWEEGGKVGKKAVRPRLRFEMAEIPKDTSSELRPLPHGWCWVHLNDISEVCGGLTKNQKRLRLPRKMKYLRVANVYADKIICDEVREIGVTDVELMTNGLQPGDLLVVEGNGSISQIGRVAMWNGQLPHCGHQNHLIRVRLLRSFSPRFVLQFLLSPIGRDLIVKEASSTSGLHTLSISKVSNLVVPVASLMETSALISKLDETLSSIDKTIEDINAILGSSEALRQSILKEAFSGQLVPQDPNDEPASILLERIRAERAAQPQIKTRKRQRRKAATT